MIASIIHCLFVEFINMTLKKTNPNNGRFKNYYRYKFITKPLDKSKKYYKPK